MRLFLFSLFSTCAVWAEAQKIPEIKFGKITAAEVTKRQYDIDTGAAAVVLADIGQTIVKGNDKGTVSLEFKHHRRIHILKQSGYDHATYEFRLYKQGDDQEQLRDLKAVTYNVENGKLVETKLNTKGSVFTEKIDRNSTIRRFAFPNVKEGSVIELEYKISSDFLFNLQPWAFQGEIPVLWSLYTVSMPQFLNYVMIEQGNLPYEIRDQNDRQGSYLVEIPKEVYGGKQTSDRYDITCAVADFRWAMKNVPAFSRDPYLNSPVNYLAKLDFQLAGYAPPFTEMKIMTTWPDLTSRLLSRADFGGQLVNNTYWIAETNSKIGRSVGTETERAARVYEYIRKNFTCTGYNQLYADSPLDKVVERKKGGVAELNLVLTALLRDAGLPADPVILSTKEHGLVNDSYPVIGPFNYVICRVKADGKEIFLDASRPALGFGKLPAACYNGTARVVNKEATVINPHPDLLTEARQTSVMLFNDPGGKWTASVNRLFGYYESEKLRSSISEKGSSGTIKEWAAAFPMEVTTDSLQWQDLEDPGQPLRAEFLARGTHGSEDVLYFTPVFLHSYQQNPFKAATRTYPVHMPYREQELYTLNMELPPGYKVDEMPKPVVLKLNDKGDIQFSYQVSVAADKLTLNYKLESRRAVFAPEEYNQLRDFYAAVQAKLQEQVVFKK